MIKFSDNIHKTEAWGEKQAFCQHFFHVIQKTYLHTLIFKNFYE